MRTLTKYALTFASIALLTGTSISSAFADYKPNRRDMGLSREQIEKLGFTSIIPLDKGVISIFQRDEAPANEILFFFAITQQIEGCYDSLPYELEQNIEGPTLTIEVKHPFLRLDAHKDCEKKRDMHKAEIAVNLDELRDNNVEFFKLTSRFYTRTYTLELDDQKIKLKPTESPLLPGLEYWFLPKNAVVLSVPMAKDDLYYKNDILQELALVAEQNGLVPVEDQIPEYLPYKYTDVRNRFFFIDTKGDVRKSLKEEGTTSVNIGSVHTTEPFYGPDGKYDKKKPLNVLATLPAALD